VQQAAVMSVKDELRSEEVLACIVLKRPMAENEAAKALFEHYNEHASPATRRRAGSTSCPACRGRECRRSRSTRSSLPALIRAALRTSSIWREPPVAIKCPVDKP
jgi:hypothetical protein